MAVVCCWFALISLSLGRAALLQRHFSESKPACSRQRSGEPAYSSPKRVSVSDGKAALIQWDQNEPRGVGFEIDQVGARRHLYTPAPSATAAGAKRRCRDLDMKPIFFGDSKRKLYGVYSAPSGSTRRSHAVLLCYPGLQEYGTSHWSFRRLSAMLAREGHHVLRFDYFGTGDSAGNVEEGSPDVWVEDIRQAALELRDLSGARHLSVLGKRLGASLAVRASRSGLDAQRLVLWDPVVSGRAYVDELESWDLRRNLLLLHAELRQTGRDELLGYRFTPALRASLNQLNLLTEPPGLAKKLSLIASEQRAINRQLCESYAKHGVNVDLRLAADAASDGPSEVEAAGRAQLSGSILNDLTSELGSEVLAA